MSANAHNRFESEFFCQTDNGALLDADLGHRRVLLIDDQAHVLRVIRMNLERRGYTVETAASSDIALPLLRQGDFFFIIVTGEVRDKSVSQLHESCSTSLAGIDWVMLVCADQDDDWVSSTMHVERLDVPISMAAILKRLDSFFGTA